ncbi:hypothetical protein LEP1GSC058_1634 [Leptospira fainei serovar Hurstbridge str. BUT 6]|uniref:Uncharacterized protein n=1 Tax=Leptospira fainei serovar Hurstbridge str. BUT 6 TaxID=1193011 RepID=S3UX68_9LEPT|nr:hypothetical protein LEP1GSC058_1634 [Leptospira fainei serovar Hurstbridge str. BUT 6]
MWRRLRWEILLKYDSPLRRSKNRLLRERDLPKIFRRSCIILHFSVPNYLSYKLFWGSSRNRSRQTNVFILY